MHKRLISFTPRQDDWLRTESKRLGVPVSELVRRVLDAHLDKEHGANGQDLHELPNDEASG